ncbi:MAG: DNA internalization-related competence protein ComEC/Rec2 [Casimicrobiaceae bacterium]
MRSVIGVCFVAFACGIALLQTRPFLPPVPGAIAVAGVCLCGLGAAWRRRSSASWSRAAYAAPLALTLSGAALFGFGYAAWRAETRLADELPRVWEGEDIRIVGVVDDLPQASSRGTRFAFAVERVATPRASVPDRVSLAWHAPRQPDGAAKDMPPIRAGERWAFTVRLKRPHGTINPGGFDLEAWLLERNLRATGYVRGDDAPQRLAAFAGRSRDYVQQSRERIRDRILLALRDAPFAGVIVALVIGDQRAIPDAQWTVFNRTGITHLVSISGLHVTVFATIAGALVFALARRSVRITTLCPARKIAATLGLFAAGGYVLLAGAEVPAVRTWAMLAVGTIGLWWGRPGTAGIVWLMALAAVLVWDPWATLSPGFWLSFGAVGMLLYAASGRIDAADEKPRHARWKTLIRRSARAQWVVTLGLTPLTLGLFEQVSLVSPLANAVAIPIVTAGVVPLALSGIVLPWDLSFQAAHALVAPLLQGLEWLAAAPAAAWQQHAPLRWTVVTGVAGTLWLLAPHGVPGRVWAILWLVPLFVVREAPPESGTFRLTVLDVGQGLAAVVAMRHHALVFDAGPRFHETADAGGRIVAPFLRHTGIRYLDGLIVSHVDLDHSGGAESLLQLVPFGWFSSSLPDDHAIVTRARAKGVALTCLAGQRWTWDDVRFTVLHPTLADVYAATKTNDRSCVVRIDTEHGSALLTGDIEAKVEARLLREGAPLKADVLVVPHHGSRTSSTSAFVTAVAPRIAVFATGYRNHFGHPRADVVARYMRVNAQIARTDQAGAISVTIGRNTGPVLEGARALAPRYWLDRPSSAAAPLD